MGDINWEPFNRFASGIKQFTETEEKRKRDKALEYVKVLSEMRKAGYSAADMKDMAIDIEGFGKFTPMKEIDESLKSFLKQSGIQQAKIAYPTPGKETTGSDNLDPTGELKNFEIATGKKPSDRGTPEYKKEFLEYMKQTKETSPWFEHMKVTEDRLRRSEGTALRKEFFDQQVVKYFLNMKDKLGPIKAAMEVAGTTKNFIAVDQTLINMYNKMMDPPSVVRESEFSRSSESQSLYNKLVGKFGKQLQGGTTLTSEDRNEIFTMAKRFYDSARNPYNDQLRNYRGYLVNAGLDPAQYLKDVVAPSAVHEKGKPYPMQVGNQVEFLIYDGVDEEGEEIWLRKTTKE